MKERSRETDGKKRYIRRIRIDSLGVPDKLPDEEPTERAKAQASALRLTVRGMHHGVVEMEATDGTMYACPKERAQGTLWGDVVEAQMIGHERVMVKRVLERAHEQIVGLMREKKRQHFIIPLERRLPQGIAVVPGSVKAQDGDIVRTRVVRWENEGGMAVRVLERIGSFDQASDALEGLIASAHLRTRFGDSVLAEADACRPADLADDPSRTDLRGIVSFTIDGRDAKDFDDAVSIEPLDNGHMLLGVHIADVGHYVPQGSELDKEAFLRGTSVYFPGRVVPMLPEQLSNGVCSLRPDEDKFTLSALMEIDGEGCVVDARFERTITRSKARLVYDDVNALFEESELLEENVAAMKNPLLAMRELARRIRARRQAQGAIDFDTEEPKFVLDADGEPVEIVSRERGEAEMMIEDFMLTANGCVAGFAKKHGIPLLYRVHEKPDPEKIGILKDFLDGIGVSTRGIRRNPAPGDIRALLESTREEPEFSVISALALRSMKKARYDAHPLGHYGLAMDDYCHFTSPIRRYPDLVVSRALTAVIRRERVRLTGDALAEAAVRSSDRERAAVDIERAADKMMMARFMQRHVGEAFDGTVSGVSEWGVYVLLTNGAEGFIHVRSLDDWFDFDERKMTLRGERTGFVFSLGQQLSVVVADVELAQSAIDLALLEPLRPKRHKESDKKKERARMRSFSR